MSKKREHSVNFWLSEEELVYLKDNISKTFLSRSDYIRKCALGKDITVVPGIRDLIIEIKKIGNDLGQLTHKVNSGSGSGVGDDLKEIKEDLKEVCGKLAKVLKKI